MSDLQNMTIRISSIEPPKSPKGPFKIKVEPYEKGISYVIWKTKQDGTDSAAFQVMSKITAADYGKLYEIGYEEKERKYDWEFEGKSGTTKTLQRTIRAIREAPMVSESVSEQGPEIGGHVEDIPVVKEVDVNDLPF